jgi:putative membrane protein
MSDKSAGYAGDIANWARGLCMGAADIVPGVSGGTMALILGHYERLVTAISHVDGKLLRLVTGRRFREASEYLDLRFLVGLGLGIVTGIIGLASLMHYLLEHQQAYTYAVFFGLILGSSWLVGRRLSGWNVMSIALMCVGGLAAWQICCLTPNQAELTPLTAFLAATVAICAMILPGISGAFVLLLLGLYHPITDLIKGLPRGEFTLSGLIIIVTFASGCLVGLLTFTRFLKWLLAQHHDSTMAFLVGLMLGSLYKIWPFQRVTAETSTLPFKEQIYEHISPADSPASLGLVLLLACLAAAGTLLLEYFGSRVAPTRSDG